jgi:ABC-type lipoprotein release transport system permease subunit
MRILAALFGLECPALIFPLANKYINGLSMPDTVLAAGLGLAVALAVLCSAVPAWRGMRLQIADALAGR